MTIFQVQLYSLNDICLHGDLNKHRGASLYAPYKKAIFWVSPLYQLYKLCLLEDVNEHAEASRCHQQMALWRPSFWVQLYWLNKLCLLGDLNECTEVSPICPLQDNFPSKLIISTCWALSPRWPEWMCRGFPACPLQDNLPSKPIIFTLWAVSWETNEEPFQEHLLSTTLLTPQALSPNRPEQMCRGFPVNP